MSDRYLSEPSALRRLASSWLLRWMVLLVVGAGVVFAYTRTSDDGDGGPAASQSQGEATDQDHEQCETAPFAPAFEILPPVAELSKGGEDDFLGFRSWECQFGMTDGSSTGVLILVATIDTTPESATSRFFGLADHIVDLELEDTYDTLGEEWDESLLSIEEDGASIYLRSLALEDDLVVDFRFSVEGEAADIDTQREALARMSENVRDFMRS